MYIYSTFMISNNLFRIAYANRILYQLQFLTTPPTDFGPQTPFSKQVYTELCAYFQGQRQQFSFSYEAQGTPFQKKVWQALTHIPYGETRSYKDIAIAIGQPAAARAIGCANHHNPLPIVIPCHRVICANGQLGGYVGGQPFKAVLLRMEAKHQ